MKTIKVSTQPKAGTKRLKVADLQPGPQMDALVAEARGWEVGIVGWNKKCYGVIKNGVMKHVYEEVDSYNPSGNGGQCFDLIDVYNIDLDHDEGITTARIWPDAGDYVVRQVSTDKKVACCLAVIASRFGETVEVEE